jgi:uncharacterized membrane protein YdbT with pleckstrin-like domain
MSYVRSVLQPGERLRKTARLHWITYWKALIVLAACLALFVASSQTPAAATEILQLAAFVAAMLVVLLSAQTLFNNATTELAVTDRRVIYKTGFISRQTVEMNVDKIETVVVDQSLLGRLLDYGTVHVKGTGQGIGNLRQVAAPLHVRNSIAAG